MKCIAAWLCDSPRGSVASRVRWVIAVSFLCVLTSCLFDLAPIFFPWLRKPGGFCSGFVPRAFWKDDGRQEERRKSCFLLLISMASSQPYWVPRPPSAAASFLPGMQAFFLDLRPRASSTSSMSISVMPQISAAPGVFIEFFHHQPVKLSAAPVLHTCTLGVGHGHAQMPMFHLQPWFHLSWILALVGKHPQLPLLLPAVWFSERGPEGYGSLTTLLVHQSVSLAAAPCAH